MDLPAVVCRFADRFSALGGAEHHVGSPLGAWLVLALAAPCATGELGEQVTDALGVDAVEAGRAASELLATPNRAVLAAAAAWTRDGLTGLDPWRAGLPAPVATGPIPDQLQADSWARDHTLGIIDTFPLDVADAMVILASALATKVTWLTPFEIVDASQLRGPWSTRLNGVLKAPRPREHDHHAFIIDTDRAGRVAVHRARADDLEVTSVIASQTVAPADVLAAAHNLSFSRAGRGGGRRSGAGEVSLFDLPLGDQPLWSIAEKQASQRGEHVEALLPAWHASSEHDLLAVPGLAFDAAGESLRRLAGVPGTTDAKQTAVARYGRRGFEAAAVTRIGIPMSARIPPPSGPYRIATVRFAHPYAVVATSTGHSFDDPWRGLPVFCAWITQPDDAHD